MSEEVQGEAKRTSSPTDALIKSMYESLAILRRWLGELSPGNQEWEEVYSIFCALSQAIGFLEMANFSRRHRPLATSNSQPATSEPGGAS